MFELDQLIELYVSTRDPSTFEEILEQLVSRTNEQNYLKITKSIENQANCSELDLSMYLYDIAIPKYTELIPIIKAKLKTFQDKDAIEDLKEALININGKSI